MKTWGSSRSPPGTVGNPRTRQAAWPGREVVSGWLGGVTDVLMHHMSLGMGPLARSWLVHLEVDISIDVTQEVCAHG